MFDWYKDISSTERRTFWACYGGWALDSFDTQMFSLVIPAIIATWGISRAAAGSVVSVSLVASALGGWISGSFADRYGRVRMLQLTVLCFSLFTFLSAFAHNLPQLLVLRALQGFGFGGEWTVGTVLIAETIRAQHRGKAMGTIQSGWAVGWALAVVLYGTISTLLPGPMGWRVLFAMGAIPALLIFYIQKWVREPSASIETRASLRSTSKFNFVQIFAPGSLRITLIGGLLGLGAHGGYYALTTWLPTYLKTERHLTVLGTSSYLGVIIGSFWCGCIIASFLLDILGRRRTILLFAVCCTLTIVFYLFIHITNFQMLLLGAPLGFFSAGIPASMGPLFSELYPTGIRGTGVGFCYNFGRVLSAIFPTLVGKLSTSIGLSFAIGLDAGFAYLLVVIAVLLLPETNRTLITPLPREAVMR